MSTLFHELTLLYPSPHIELNYSNPFELLVAVMLSARTKDVSVNKITPDLFCAAPTPRDMIALGLDGVKQHINTIGLYNTKANNLIKLSHLLIDKYQGEIPSTLEDLMTLPGIGRKTAQVVLNTLYLSQHISVDTHVFRVAKRIGLATGSTPLDIEKELLQVVPEIYQDKISRRLVLHGRYICTSRKPKCQLCPLQQWCSFYKNNV